MCTLCRCSRSRLDSDRFRSNRTKSMARRNRSFCYYSTGIPIAFRYQSFARHEGNLRSSPGDPEKLLSKENKPVIRLFKFQRLQYRESTWLSSLDTGDRISISLWIPMFLRLMKRFAPRKQPTEPRNNSLICVLLLCCCILRQMSLRQDGIVCPVGSTSSLRRPSMALRTCRFPCVLFENYSLRSTTWSATRKNKKNDRISFFFYLVIFFFFFCSVDFLFRKER